MLFSATSIPVFFKASAIPGVAKKGFKGSEKGLVAPVAGVGALVPSLAMSFDFLMAVCLAPVPTCKV